jgi:hypothetical protein
VSTRDEGGAGVVDKRCWGAGVSDGGFSMAGAEARGRLKCAAVVRIAFRRSMLFCCRFGVSDEVGPCRFEEMEEASSSAMALSSSGLGFLMLSSCIEGSVIGHTKPVRGV